MKHLPKHLQPRYRYLAVGLETWPDADVDRRAFQRETWAAARGLLGDVGSAELELEVFRFDYADGSGEAIVRTRRGAVDRARAVLACIERIDGAPVGVHVRGVSGTVRGCTERYLGRQPEDVDQRHVVFENAERRAVVRGERADVDVDGAYAGATTLEL
ncbi:MAG: Rpp14/Pop5 family protein [Haloplanus sp.]|jgi:ribonuclease P/MRP protein subunit POP5